MSAYTIYKELFPPQTVEHVEQAHFTSPVAINLIVAKGSLVQIYNFIEYEPETQGSLLQNDEIDDALKTNNIDTFPVGDNDDDNVSNSQIQFSYLLFYQLFDMSLI